VVKRRIGTRMGSEKRVVAVVVAVVGPEAEAHGVKNRDRDQR